MHFTLESFFYLAKLNVKPTQRSNPITKQELVGEAAAIFSAIDEYFAIFLSLFPLKTKFPLFLFCRAFSLKGTIHIASIYVRLITNILTNIRRGKNLVISLIEGEISRSWFTH